MSTTLKRCPIPTGLIHTEQETTKIITTTTTTTNNNNTTYNNNEVKTKNDTSPILLFLFFVLLNFITFVDRGIVPGASREFAAFAASSSDSPKYVINNPDVGIGVLQSAFIFGYAIAIIFAGHLVHTTPWKKLVMTGLTTWIISVIISGLSRQWNSYVTLLLSRMVSGVSEASFQIIAPPMFQDRGEDIAGLWLSIFYTAVPVGLANGYIYGSLIANNWGWQWAFYVEGLSAIPLLVFCCFLRDEVNDGVLAVIEEDGKDGKDEDDAAVSAQLVDRTTQSAPCQYIPKIPQTPLCKPCCMTTKKNSLWEEIRVCTSNKILVSIILGNSAFIAVISTLGTFGGAFILALELLDSEEQGALMFGCAAAFAGMIGTPLGGVFTDRVVNTQHHHHNNNRNNVTSSSFVTLSSLLRRVNIGILIGFGFCIPTIFVSDPILFLACLFFAWVFLFATQSSISVSTMMSVDKSHRPNAIAFSALMSHLMGDVPAPIVFGGLKDLLAPACTIMANGDVKDMEKCREQHVGIRKCLAIAYSWLLWSVLFFELARYFAKRTLKKEQQDRVDNILGTNDGSKKLMIHQGNEGDQDETKLIV